MVNTPVNVENLRQELQTHPDRDFVDYLCDGLTYGFDTMISDITVPTKECSNLRSALERPDTVDSLIKSETQKGFLEGPFLKPPFARFRVSPIGVAIGKYSGKPRLIVDLSSPHDNEEHVSVNEMIDKDHCSLSYVKIDDAIKIIQKLGKGTTMCKTDIADAFKLMPITPSQWHMYCIKWRQQYYFYTRLAFGCRSSPKIFDTLSKAICWIAEHNYGIKYILHLLDDFITFENPLLREDGNMKLLYHIFNYLNVPMALHKTHGPDTTMEYLGIILDSINLESRLPKDKLERINQFLQNFLQRKSCTKRELLQLLGHLNFASRVVIPGRSFVSHLIGLSTTVKALHHHVKINEECREDVRMWLYFLSSWNGVSVFYNTHSISSDDLNLFTDASLTIGFGGYFNGLWFSEAWPDDISTYVPLQSDETISIAFCELYPIVVAAKLWGHMWKRQRIVFLCDNMSTVAIIQKGRSKSQHIMPLMRSLTMLSARHQFTFASVHLPRKFNELSDALSRLQIDKFHHMAPWASPVPTLVPPPEDVLWSSKVL